MIAAAAFCNIVEQCGEIGDLEFWERLHDRRESRELVVVHRVDTDVKGTEVNAHQLGRLFDLILDAGPAG